MRVDAIGVINDFLRIVDVSETRNLLDTVFAPPIWRSDFQLTLRNFFVEIIARFNFVSAHCREIKSLDFANQKLPLKEFSRS